MGRVTQREAMRAYEVTDQTLRNWCQKYGMNRYLIDGRVYYSTDDLELAEYRSRHWGRFPQWAQH